MKAADLTGKRFGKLVAIERVSVPGKKRKQWKCDCDCGNTSFVEAANLVRGNSTSCGCGRIEATTKIKAGMRFGRLVVIERDGVLRYGKKTMSKWYCQCDCGTFHSVLGNSLMQGLTRSCGCLLRESGRKNGAASFEDIRGTAFGRLQVVERATIEGDVPTKWLCACSCGRLSIVSATSLKSGNTLSCGCVKKNGESMAPDHVRLKRRINAGRRRAAQLFATKPFDHELFELVEVEAHELAQSRSAKTGIQWDVDHIVPLQSNVVCGLHNENNLRVIPSSENYSKSNKHWPDMP